MVTKLVFTMADPTFLDEYDLEVLETFDLGERHAAKVRIASNDDVGAVLTAVEGDDRVEGIEDSFDAELR